MTHRRLPFAAKDDNISHQPEVRGDAAIEVLPELPATELASAPPLPAS